MVFFIINNGCFNAVIMQKEIDTKLRLFKSVLSTRNFKVLPLIMFVLILFFLLFFFSEIHTKSGIRASMVNNTQRIDCLEGEI